MTKAQYFKEYEKELGETNAAYIKRIADMGGFGHESVRSAYYEHKKMVTVEQRLDKNGNVLSEKQVLRGQTFDAPTDHVITRTTTNLSTGQQWIRTQSANDKAIDIEKIDGAIIQAVKALNLKRVIEPKDTREVAPDSLILVYTDTHVGMDANKDGHALYGNEWNEEILEERRKAMVRAIRKKVTASIEKVYIFDLGDFADGYNAQTTRGGHALPQNMDNEKAFEVGGKFKIELVRDITALGVQVETHNVTNDNHSGSFGYIINKYADEVTKAAYGAKNHIYRRFINHVIIGNHCFVFTHGKDRSERKYGFPVLQNKDAIEHIANYIDHYDLKGYHVHFMKGDSHQALFDLSNMKWDYLNYPALSPSSGWVQTNYSKGRPGFVVHSLRDSERCIGVEPFEF